MFGAEETQKKSEQPLVIRHHNERALRLRDINASRFFLKCLHLCIIDLFRLSLILAPGSVLIFLFLNCVFARVHRWLRVLIRQRWSSPWCGCLQLGSWSTLELSRETAPPAGTQSNSSYNTTAQTVRNQLAFRFAHFSSEFVCFFMFLTVLSHRCCVMAGGGAFVSSECVWEYGTDQARPKGCTSECCWSTGNTGTSTATDTHNNPLGQPTILRWTAA